MTRATITISASTRQIDQAFERVIGTCRWIASLSFPIGFDA